MDDTNPTGNVVRIPARRGPGTTGYTWDLEAVEDIVAELGVKRSLLEAGFGVSHDVITKRLKDNPDFKAACDRGMFRFRLKMLERLNKHADKNALVALAFANQPEEHGGLGWTNGRQDISGKIEHVHSISPAMQAFADRRKERQTRVEVKDNPSINAMATQPDVQDADVIEVEHKD